MSNIRVIVVDDSPTMRGVISAALERAGDIDVVATAADPLEARAAIKALNPDVITLDVEMPKMDGLSFLEKIMRLRPMPVVMISTLTEKGAAVSVEALRLGAFDCVCKPQGEDPVRAFKDLPDLVRSAAKANIRQKSAAKEDAPRVAYADFAPNNNLIAIGSSTGGVDALAVLLRSFPANCPPTVVTQHMPESFTKSFAARLNQMCAPTVSEARAGAPLEVGQIYLAPGGNTHLEVDLGSRQCRITDGERVTGHIPSVDVLFNSAASFGKRCVGVILTGMGRDGARGLLHIRNEGGITFGQDEATSVVYGMPRVAHESGAVETQLPLEKIASAVLDVCNKNKKTKAA